MTKFTIGLEGPVEGSYTDLGCDFIDIEIAEEVPESYLADAGMFIRPESAEVIWKMYPDGYIYAIDDQTDGTNI